MATLENIRKRGPVVAIVIGLALLAFILGDLLNSSQSFFQNDQLQVAEIGGTSVQIQEYQEYLDGLIKVREIQQGGAAIDANTMEQLRRQAWDYLLSKYVMEEEYSKLGIAVSAEELFDLVQGTNIDPIIIQAFSDPQTGAFNPADVVNFLQQMDLDETGNSKAMWLYIESEILNRRAITKYNNLVAKGMYATQLEAKQQYLNSEKTVDVKFIQKSFTEISDSSISVTDEEILAYYKENEHLFKQEASRDIEYVVFPIIASEKDIEDLKIEMEDVLKEFKNTDDPIAYARSNSDAQMVESFFRRGEMSGEMDSLMFFAEKGFVYGPYMEGNSFKVARLISRESMADSVKASHVLIRVDGTNYTLASAKSLLDSLKTQLDNGADFKALAAAFSQDGSAQNGGDLGWFTIGQMVKPFSDACFAANVNDIFIVETQFGVHLVQLTGKLAPVEKVNVVFVERFIEASDETRTALYMNASKFAAENKTYEAFNNAINADGLPKRLAPGIRDMDSRIMGLEEPRELVRAAFRAEKGDLLTDFDSNPVFELGLNYVVAILTETREKGIGTVEQQDIHDRIVFEVTKKKKAQMLTEQITAALSTANTIDELALKLNQQVKVASNLSFSSPQLTGVGQEYKVIATALELPKGQLSKPIADNMGVYVIVVEGGNEITNKDDYTAERNLVLTGNRSRASYEPFNALKEVANIIDGRAKFF